MKTPFNYKQLDGAIARLGLFPKSGDGSFEGKTHTRCIGKLRDWCRDLMLSLDAVIRMPYQDFAAMLQKEYVARELSEAWDSNFGKNLKETFQKEWDRVQSELVSSSLQKTAPTTSREGWICPVCGRGNAPWSNVCPCIDDSKKAFKVETPDTPLAEAKSLPTQVYPKVFSKSYKKLGNEKIDWVRTLKTSPLRIGEIVGWTLKQYYFSLLFFNDEAWAFLSQVQTAMPRSGGPDSVTKGLSLVVNGILDISDVCLLSQPNIIQEEVPPIGIYTTGEPVYPGSALLLKVQSVEKILDHHTSILFEHYQEVFEERGYIEVSFDEQPRGKVFSLDEFIEKASEVGAYEGMVLQTAKQIRELITPYL